MRGGPPRPGPALRLLRAGALAGAMATTGLLAFTLATRSANAPRHSWRPSAPLPEPPAPRTAALELRARGLAFPVPAAAGTRLRDSFGDGRSGGLRTHEAIDIFAARQAAVVAVDDGRLERLQRSPLGGITVLQRDPTGWYCYYYAHLDGYAPGLVEGQPLRRGQVLGSVGSTGNASPRTPHLHFAIWAVAPGGRCTGAEPVNPYVVFAPPGGSPRG